MKKSLKCRLGMHCLHETEETQRKNISKRPDVEHDRFLRKSKCCQCDYEVWFY